MCSRRDGRKLDAAVVVGRAGRPTAVAAPSFIVWSKANGREAVEDVSRAEALVRLLAPWLVHVIEACSVLTILYGVVRAVGEALLSGVRRPARVSLTRIRLDLGCALSLALEFLLAADILQTMVSPTLEQVGILGAIAVIRTGLNYFLGKEIKEEQEELREAAATGRDGSVPLAPTPSATRQG
jgi:uncharacterized membrane protein